MKGNVIEIAAARPTVKDGSSLGAASSTDAPADVAVAAVPVTGAVPPNGALAADQTPAPSGLARRFLKVLAIGNRRSAGGQVMARLRRTESFHCRCDLVPDAASARSRLAVERYDACIVAGEAEAPADALQPLRELDAAALELPVLLVLQSGQAVLDRDALTLGATDVLDLADLGEPRFERTLRLALLRKHAAMRLDRLAQLDGLTGLGNRVLLQDRLDQALAAARRSRTQLAVMMLDLNGFKAINDGLGHQAGDELLRQLALRLKNRLRASDTIARVGGDEFATIIEHLHRPDDAVLVGRKLLDAIEPPFLIDGHPVGVTASLGIALFPDQAETGARLLKLADGAMYAAKSQGGNRWYWPGSDLALSARNIAGRSGDLLRALESGAIELGFEPQQPLCSDRLGIGTVLRWRHPELGPIGGRAIGDLASADGLVDRLSAWLVTTLCAQARRWHRASGRPFHLCLPVLARAGLDWTALAAGIVDELQRHGLPRAMLELEIDEDLLGQEIGSGGAGFGVLEKHGLRVAANGIGRDSCALQALRECPLTTMRLAPLVLADVPRGERATRFARALIRLGRDLGLRIVADGVESAEQGAFLRNEGCDALRGHSQIRTLDAETCGEWIKAQPLRAPSVGLAFESARGGGCPR